MKNIILAAKVVIIAATGLIALNAQAQRQQQPQPAPVRTYSAPNSAPGVTGYFPLGMKHEIDINLSQGFIHVYKYGNKSFTDINILGSYSHSLGSGLQILGEGGISSYIAPSSGDNKNLLTAMGGVTYNFNADLVDAVFAQAAIGLMPAQDKNAPYDYSSKFSFFVGAGKRFTLFHRLSAKPIFRIYKRGDMDMDYLLMPFNISMFF